MNNNIKFILLKRNTYQCIINPNISIILNNLNFEHILIKIALINLFEKYNIIYYIKLLDEIHNKFIKFLNIVYRYKNSLKIK